MQITVEYAAQARAAARTGSERFELPAPCSLRNLLAAVLERHGDPIRSLLFDGGGELRRSVLLFVGDAHVRGDSAIELAPSDTVTIMTPISGG